jgi:hypothetical protein
MLSELGDKWSLYAIQNRYVYVTKSIEFMVHNDIIML